MKNTNEYHLNLRPRETETISVAIPKDTLEALRKVASLRDMSDIALLKFYVGQGLRQDLSRLHSDHILETTAQVLSRYIQSEEELSEILREIRAAGEYKTS
ncbi:MAG: hypothetical protein KC421_21060 [Anaerolineales bacterium]|nr:hypothetical protein [Anaerolineales bacterium]